MYLGLESVSEELMVEELLDWEGLEDKSVSEELMVEELLDWEGLEDKSVSEDLMVEASLCSSIVTFIASLVGEVNKFSSKVGEATFTLVILENKSDPVLILKEIRPSGLGEEDTVSILIG